MTVRTVLFSITLSFFLVGCDKKKDAARPIPDVTVTQLELSAHRPEKIFVGRLASPEDINIQAKSTGYLTGRFFIEGAVIQKGDLLFEIDKAPYEAALQEALATIAEAKANTDIAKLNYNRGLKLVKSGTISLSEMDELTAKHRQVEAALNSAKASAKQAEINLGYTAIVAPITGRIGRSLFSVGDLIGPDSGSLTSLASIDTIYVNFQVSETLFLDFQHNQIARGEPLTTHPKADIYIELANKTLHPYPGVIDFVANRVDASTGTLQVRAVIPNPEGNLRPGQYVRAIVKLLTSTDILLIPQAALQSDQQGLYALMVNDEHMVKRQNITIGARIKENVIVLSGLKQGDNVIIHGLQQVKPGQTVTTRMLPPRESTQVPKA